MCCVFILFVPQRILAPMRYDFYDYFEKQQDMGLFYSCIRRRNSYLGILIILKKIVIPIIKAYTMLQDCKNSNFFVKPFMHNF